MQQFQAVCVHKSPEVSAVSNLHWTIAEAYLQVSDYQLPESSRTVHENHFPKTLRTEFHVFEKVRCVHRSRPGFRCQGYVYYFCFLAVCSLLFLLNCQSSG